MLMQAGGKDKKPLNNRVDMNRVRTNSIFVPIPPSLLFFREGLNFERKNEKRILELTHTYLLISAS